MEEICRITLLIIWPAQGRVPCHQPRAPQGLVAWYTAKNTLPVQAPQQAMSCDRGGRADALGPCEHALGNVGPNRPGVGGLVCSMAFFLSQNTPLATTLSVLVTDRLTPTFFR